MKVAKNDSPPEMALQALENFLQTNQMTIQHGHRGLVVTFENRLYELRDIEMSEDCYQLPRIVDSERMVVAE